MTNRKEITIEVCMGSSCFMRGNAENLQYIEAFIHNHKIESKIELFGSRCKRQCDKGPNVIIDGQIYNNVSTEDIEKILDEKFLSVNLR